MLGRSLNEITNLAIIDVHPQEYLDQFLGACEKLDVDNSVDLVRKAVAMGLIDLLIEQNST